MVSSVKTIHLSASLAHLIALLAYTLHFATLARKLTFFKALITGVLNAFKIVHCV